MVGLNMSHRLITLATCNLDQWAMDFEGNLKRVMESIRIAKQKGATYRARTCLLPATTMYTCYYGSYPPAMQLGPELELPGYGCEDHFQELDTVEHCWECMSGRLYNAVELQIWEVRCMLQVTALLQNIANEAFYPVYVNVDCQYILALGSCCTCHYHIAQLQHYMAQCCVYHMLIIITFASTLHLAFT